MFLNILHYILINCPFSLIIIIFFVEMTNSSTIIVRHLPPQLTSEQKEEFLRYFGAKYVKILTSKTTKKCTAYARY